MRKELGKALRETFSKSLRERLPRFREAAIKSMYLGPGERVFEWRHSDAIRLFVILVPHQKGAEAFTVELGWSTLGRFPELGVRPSMHRPRHGADLQEPEYVCRLGELARGGDYWWAIRDSTLPPPISVEDTLASLKRGLEPMAPEQARELVLPVVTDALESLQGHGMPYLEDWLERA